MIIEHPRLPGFSTSCGRLSGVPAVPCSTTECPSIAGFRMGAHLRLRWAVVPWDRRRRPRRAGHTHHPPAPQASWGQVRGASRPCYTFPATRSSERSRPHGAACASRFLPHPQRLVTLSSGYLEPARSSPLGQLSKAKPKLNLDIANIFAFLFKHLRTEHVAHLLV